MLCGCAVDDVIESGIIKIETLRDFMDRRPLGQSLCRHWNTDFGAFFCFFCRRRGLIALKNDNSKYVGDIFLRQQQRKCLFCAIDPIKCRLQHKIIIAIKSNK